MLKNADEFVQHLTNDHPWAAVTVAVAVGGVLGAVSTKALPRSTSENGENGEGGGGSPVLRNLLHASLTFAARMAVARLLTPRHQSDADTTDTRSSE